MTREKDRIPEILDELETYWNQNPDLRLGQILCNIGTKNGYQDDPFYMEDDELLEQLKKCNRDSGSSKS